MKFSFKVPKVNRCSKVHLLPFILEVLSSAFSVAGLTFHFSGHFKRLNTNIVKGSLGIVLFRRLVQKINGMEGSTGVHLLFSASSCDAFTAHVREDRE